jgi:tRNA (cmo5U34)-methyltransferase
MKRNVGDNISAEKANWTFGGDVACSFDEHVSKSVPLYKEGHDLVLGLSDFFIKNDSVVYEIGCSTGMLISKLAESNRKKENAKFVGVDVEQGMIDFAKNRYSQITNLDFLCDDAISLEMQESDFIVCYYTIQFIRPSLRQLLIDKLYNKLKWGGALVLFEKVRGSDARFQDILSILYNEYKLQQGYSSDDIMAKSLSLKGVLEPFSTQGNIDMLKRAGFVDINTVQKYLCFEGFLAIK